VPTAGFPLVNRRLPRINAHSWSTRADEHGSRRPVGDHVARVRLPSSVTDVASVDVSIAAKPVRRSPA